MTWPQPQPGLVIRYAYLWQREAQAGLEEGRKDRPCAIILAVGENRDGRRVYVVPITHSMPSGGDDAVELPPRVKERLGLDEARSWVVVSEANVFVWPGPDLRFLPGQDPQTAAYGFLPPTLFRMVRDRFLAVAGRRNTALVTRTE